jgi:acetate kinase
MSAADPNRKLVLALNAGSSSLKFAVFAGEAGGERVLSGKFDRVGLAGSDLSYVVSGCKSKRQVALANHAACLPLLETLLRELGFEDFAAVGHRVVHGGPSYSDPVRISEAVLEELHRLEPFAPNHLPSAVSLMEFLLAHRPSVPQIACFDTAFHHGLPPAARLLPIPRRYAAEGVHRYGFHGLAFQSVMAELRRREVGTVPAKIILAHLGNGASMAAVRDGRSVDTTMGFTPAGGLVMSTRSGDIDPGLVTFLAARGVGVSEFQRLFSAESGLLGLSETSSDMRDLLAREAADARAAEALAVFCHQARKFIGALAAVLGGLDALVFSGGVGENSAVIRQRLCAGFEFLGLTLDPARNEDGSPMISSDRVNVNVHIIPPDEVLVLAQAARELIASPQPAFSPAK